MLRRGAWGVGRASPAALWGLLGTVPGAGLPLERGSIVLMRTGRANTAWAVRVRTVEADGRSLAWSGGAGPDGAEPGLVWPGGAGPGGAGPGGAGPGLVGLRRLRVATGADKATGLDIDTAGGSGMAAGRPAVWRDAPWPAWTSG